MKQLPDLVSKPLFPASIIPTGNYKPQKRLKWKEAKVNDQRSFQLEVAGLIISALELEDIEAADIGANDPLFGDGLGLDSIDALEIALAIAQRYGVEMQAEEESTREAFASLETLCVFITDNQAT